MRCVRELATPAEQPARGARTFVRRYSGASTPAGQREFMSFVHFLTVGLLDPHAIARREVQALQPLPEEVRQLVARHADPHSVSSQATTVTFLIGGQ
jgi:hypothetical protein